MPFFKKEQKAINGLWYPRTVTVGHPVEMDEVCKRIAEMSTASEADTKAVMTALGKVLGSLMNTGRTVHIEGLGSFYYGCVAEGTGKETADEVTAECITATRVRFLPVFWVDVESMGANPDKVESPDDETEEGNDGSFG